ncbi:MAG: YARHG domain-containing protein [Bacteroidetes bacterium]|nr:YARHG domain-containing protein [Bacteroidota bacterium]
MRKLLILLPILFLFSCEKSETNIQKDDEQNRDGKKIENSKSNNEINTEMTKKRSIDDFKYDPNLELSDGVFVGDFHSITDVINKNNASVKLLKKKDIENLYKDELEIIRNLIFARHGYIFKSENILSRMEWYIPRSENVSDELTEIELKNIELIKRYEPYAKKIDFNR